MSTNDFHFFQWLKFLDLDMFFGEQSWPILEKKVWETELQFILLQNKKEFDKFPLLVETKF